jgi:hypothetical protein
MYLQAGGPGPADGCISPPIVLNKDLRRQFVWLSALWEKNIFLWWAAKTVELVNAQWNTGLSLILVLSCSYLKFWCQVSRNYSFAGHIKFGLCWICIGSLVSLSSPCNIHEMLLEGFLQALYLTTMINMQARLWCKWASWYLDVDSTIDVNLTFKSSYHITDFLTNLWCCIDLHYGSIPIQKLRLHISLALLSMLILKAWGKHFFSMNFV